MGSTEQIISQIVINLTMTEYYIDLIQVEAVFSCNKEFRVKLPYKLSL